MDSQPGHPPADRIEALAFGQLAEPQTRLVREHVETCPSCASILAREEDVRRKLSLLREGEPRVDVVSRVLRSIDAAEDIEAPPSGTPDDLPGLGRARGRARGRPHLRR